MRNQSDDNLPWKILRLRKGLPVATILDYDTYLTLEGFNSIEMKRYIEEQINPDLWKKMVFIGGPRQVGKTYLSKSLLTNWPDALYLNYDNINHRQMIRAQEWCVIQPFPTADSRVSDHSIQKYPTADSRVSDR